MLMVVATFVLVLGLVLGPYWLLIARPEDRSGRDLRKRLKVTRTAKTGAVDLLRTEKPLSAVASLDRLLKRSAGLTAPLHETIERSGLNVTVGVVVLSSAFFGVLTFAVVYALTRLAAAGLVLGLMSTALPYLFIRFKAHRRLLLFEEQFPEALDLIARALRAGHAFTTGLAMAAEEIPEPVGAEFQLVHDRQNYGMPLPDALRDFGRRVPLLDARFFVTAVLTQRESGGNLAEVLDNLAALIRERFTVKRQVRTLSAHGRMTGWVLALLAPVLAVALTVIAPQHMAVMVQDPLGPQMIVAALVLQVVGILIMRRIINIEV